MNSIKLTRDQAKDIIARSFPDYRGRKISVVFTQKVGFHGLYWSGGSKSDYVVLRSDGTYRALDTTFTDPWSDRREGAVVDLPDNVIVVKHQIFCGKDAGITIYANPSLAPKWLTC